MEAVEAALKFHTLCARHTFIMTENDFKKINKKGESVTDLK